MNKKCNLFILTFYLFLLPSLFSVENKQQKKVALIFGVTGQDGRYLSELLLEKGYEVHGVKRRSSSFNTQRLDHLIKEKKENSNLSFILHYGDITDSTNVMRLIQEIRPDEIYNLAAQSHVRVSFEIPEYTSNVDGLGTLRILEAIKNLGLKNIRFYQASTSELFGNALAPQGELTSFNPRSPYAISKLFGYWITVNYREAYGLFACNGILFNHESPFRGETFVTRKITRAVVRIKHELQEILYLGNLDARRDWGFAGDYVRAMWLMLQQDMPDDYVIATGQAHSVREFIELAFACVGINIRWQGKGIDEKGIDIQTGKVIVAINPIYFRPTEVDLLIGDAHKAHEKLGWYPSMNFKELVKLMIDSDEVDALKEKKDIS